MKSGQTDGAPCIGVISPCGWGNLGDAAIVTATIEGLQARVPKAKLFGITSNPKDTEQRHQIPAFPLTAERYKYKDDIDTHSAEKRVQSVSGRSAASSGFSLRKAKWLSPLRKIIRRGKCFLQNIRSETRHTVACMAIARDADLLIIAGGGQLDDYWGGAWVYPFNLLKWGCVARLAGTPIAILSVGYGTNPSRLSRLFLRAFLRLSAYCSFRDIRTVSVVREALGVPDPAFVPDLAFGLTVNQQLRTASGKRTVVGISPIAFADPRAWPVKNALLYENYLNNLALFADWLSRQGYDLIFFCTDNMDVQCLRDLHERSAGSMSWLDSDAVRPLPYYKDVDVLMAQLARADLVVASRLHGIILAHRLAKPVMAISYDWKVDVHMSQVGETDDVLDIRSLKYDTLVAGFQRLVERRHMTEQRLRSTAAEYAGQISTQFDLIVDKFIPKQGVPKRS